MQDLTSLSIFLLGVSDHTRMHAGASPARSTVKSRGYLLQQESTPSPLVDSYGRFVTSSQSLLLPINNTPILRRQLHLMASQIAMSPVRKQDASTSGYADTTMHDSGEPAKKHCRVQSPLAAHGNPGKRAADGHAAVPSPAQ